MGRPTTPRSAGNGACHRFRTIVLLAVGCILFPLLHNAFGPADTASTKVSKTFPRKIWQSWKIDPLRFEARDAERAMTWTVKNPGYRYEVLTDDNAAAYVEAHFGPEGFNRPDIVSIYTGLKARVIQADLLRYLIMYVEGGVWADIDVEALRPVDRFVPKRFEHRRHEIGLIIGIETDEPGFLDHPVLGSKAQSFCQWTFVAAPRLPVMMRLIDNILIWLSKLSAEQGKPISELSLDFDEVLGGTGPSAFTKAISADLSARTRRNVTWNEFHDMDESQIVGSTLILTSQAFAAGTGHSSSGNHDVRSALVKHHFHASSWTTAHPRYKHPIYGEVEKCNWDAECTKLWDANTAFFAALPKEDQMKMIAMRDRDEAIVALEEMPDEMPSLPIDLPPNDAPAGGEFDALPEALSPSTEESQQNVVPLPDLPVVDVDAQEVPLISSESQAAVDIPRSEDAQTDTPVLLTPGLDLAGWDPGSAVSSSRSDTADVESAGAETTNDEVGGTAATDSQSQGAGTRIQEADNTDTSRQDAVSQEILLANLLAER